MSSMSYTPPVRELLFAAELAGLAQLTKLPRYADANAELMESILHQAAKFGAEVLAPLNHRGDQQGVRLENGQTFTASGWKPAYQQFVDAGWNSLPFDPAHGGQGLPWLLATAVQEIWHAANMAFSLCPLLTQGAIEALQLHGSTAQKDTYLPKMITGEWAGTMNLTESQAGSDLSAVRTKAEPHGEHYLLRGQKIFITYGDHDLTPNIIHMVLARTPHAPPGSKGISLFIVPKYLPNEHGEWCIRNDVETVSLEHKLGIHACPTATLNYGSQAGAVGYLVGEENRGLMYMFTMMNVARHAVGVEANGVAERAYQQAVDFAQQRVQGYAVEGPNDARVTISKHADVKRLLLLQKARIEALRALTLVNAAAMDLANHGQAEQQTHAAELVEILIPIVKGYTTEMGMENVSLALQVHGGMGFIEETGAAQHYRDQRITPIYEGTTGIQAMDLIGRKLLRDSGSMTRRVFQRLRAEVEQVSADNELASLRAQALDALEKLQVSAEHIVDIGRAEAQVAAAVGEPYLRLCGVVLCGCFMLHAAVLAQAKLNASPQDKFYANKITTARFYFATEMPKVDYLCHIIQASGEVVAAADDQFFRPVG